MAARTLSLYTFLLAIVLALGACKKDDFANSTVDELSKLADDIAAEVKKGDDRKAGVAAAQKLLDAKKPELLPKMKEVMELRGIQVSEETAGRVNEVRTKAGLKVAGLQLELISDVSQDPDLEKGLDKLIDDFTSLVDGE